MIIITTNVDEDSMLFTETFYSLFHDRNCCISTSMGPTHRVACSLSIVYWGEILIQLKCFRGNCFKVNSSEAFTPLTVLCNQPSPSSSKTLAALQSKTLGAGSNFSQLPRPSGPWQQPLPAALCRHGFIYSALSCQGNPVRGSLLSGVFGLAFWFGGSSTV